MIVKKVPNLENATEIRRITRGTFGDPHGYEEILMRTRNNRYVIVKRGGAYSPYPGETIEQILKADATRWLESAE